MSQWLLPENVEDLLPNQAKQLEIYRRQLLDLYDMGDQQQTQLVKTYELAKERLKQLESQHYELGETIKELKEQLVLGKELMVQAKLSYEPAE